MSSAAATRSSPVADRPAGSNRGRPSIDWEEAFTYYASLPDTARSYRALADQYGVSVRTVELHGRRERWRERLAQIKAEAAATADQLMVQTRAEQIAELNLLIDASLTTYAQQLRAGMVKVVPGDLLRLFKLREELFAQEAAERGEQRAREVVHEDPEDTEARRRELIAALEEAGAFDRLRNLVNPPSDPVDDEPDDPEKAEAA